MIDVEWNDNAKAAVREFAEYVGKTKHCERYLERIVPKQPKTVADAVEQEGEKWTHTTQLGDKCYIKDNEQDCEGVVLVVVKNLGYDLMKPEQLKPIKPTISESDAKALEVFANKSHRHGVAWAVKEYLNGHDII